PIGPIFALSEFTQLFHLVPSEPRRQSFNRHVSPRSAVSRSPEPMVTMEIVVVAADEKDVIGNTHGHVHIRLRQHDHCWGRVHNDGRWLADVDVYAHLGTRGSCQESKQQHRTQDHPAFCPHHKVTPLSLDIQASLTRIHAIGNRRSTPAGLRDKPLRPNMRSLAIKFVAGRESSRPVIPMSVIRESDFLVVLDLWLFHVRKSVFHVRISLLATSGNSPTAAL